MKYNLIEVLGLAVMFEIVSKNANIIFLVLILMLIDYISGVLKALIDGTASSKQGLIGIFKKTAILLLVTLAVVLEPIIDANITRYVCYFIVGNETLSIIENLQGCGLPMTPVFNVFKTIGKKFKGEKDENDKTL